MNAARQGIVTPQMRDVLAVEPISEQDLLEKVATGKIAIPANKNHANLVGGAVGEGLRTKINVNLGVSEDCCNLDMEMKKVESALALKTDTIMDLSTFGRTREFRRKVVDTCPVMIGTVPVYDAVAKYKKDPTEISVDEFFQVVDEHAEDGVDFMTIHAGLTRVAVERIRKNMRLTHVVSRGGSVLLEWMEVN